MGTQWRRTPIYLRAMHLLQPPLMPLIGNKKPSPSLMRAKLGI